MWQKNCQIWYWNCKCDNGTIKFEKQIKEPLNVKKITIKCDFGIARCDNGTVKCEKQIEESPNVTKELSNVMLELHNVRIEVLDVRKK